MARVRLILLWALIWRYFLFDLQALGKQGLYFPDYQV